MKLVTFLNDQGVQRAGWVQDGMVIDMQLAGGGMLPDNVLDFIRGAEAYFPIANRLEQQFSQDRPLNMFPLQSTSLCAPITNPPSVRDFYAFEQHVKTARSKRGLEMIPEWYEFPAFYFSNHRSIIGPEDAVRRPRKCKWLDYELEIACIIGREGRDIRADEAEDYIFGYCIMNDWSARDVQRQEMKVGLGPAKGKDFATSLGPYLVTKDELEPFRSGTRYNLEMTAKVNGRLLSHGNLGDIYYTFAQMIEHASEDAVLYPGDVIGSGTASTGCILELGTEVHRWLEPGDVVEFEVTGLGVLRNNVE